MKFHFTKEVNILILKNGYFLDQQWFWLSMIHVASSNMVLFCLFNSLFSEM